MNRLKYSCNSIIVFKRFNKSSRDFMHWLWVLIIGAIIGAIAGAITNKGKSMGWISNIIAGLVGSAIGEALLGSWGPQLAGMAIVPSIIGGVIVVAITSFVLTRMD
ncbi:GlsB/YeaQ/YmgE family stress response membrane protein [Lactiplantibacillus plantarum]